MTSGRTLRGWLGRSRDDVAAGAAAAAARTVGVTDPPRRRGDGTTSAVFTAGPAVLVVARAGTQPEALRRRIALAAVLSDGAPVVRPWPGLDHALCAQGRLVTVWERVPVTDDAVSWRAAGATLQALHGIDPDAAAGTGQLRAADDLSGVPGVLNALRDKGLLSAPGLATLTEVTERLAAELDRVPGDPVVLHGDLHRPNLLVSGESVVLCDLDEIGVGHRDHDLGFLVDPGRPTLSGSAERAAFEAGYGGLLPSVERARSVSRVAHLRRTVRLIAQHDPGPREAYYRALRLSSWADVRRDWTLDIHPVLAQPRGAQIRRLVRTSRFL